MRTRCIFINGRSMKLLISGFEEHRQKECRAIQYADYKETIDKHFTINMKCELSHKGKVTAIMFRSKNSQILCSVECKNIPQTRQMCSPCRRMKRQLQSLARIDRQPIPAPKEIHQPGEQEEQSQIRNRINKPCCKWTNCNNTDPFEDVLDLNFHINTHIPQLLNIPPNDRIYICQWEGCSSTKKKRKELVSHVKINHSGM